MTSSLLNSYIKSIEYYFPNNKDYNEPTDRLTKKIGIDVKNIAAEDEFASDLAFQAATKLFISGVCNPSEIDFLLYCTQSPDYLLPTTACILQERLGLPTHCGALDFNLGCSGYVYGLSLAKGLLETGMAKNVILITADTYSKYINAKDQSVKPLFGDAASATLISVSEDLDQSYIGPFVFGTDGRGADNLIVQAGGLRLPSSGTTSEEISDSFGNIRCQNNLFMNGAEIFNFAMNEVPKAVIDLLRIKNENIEDYNYFVFHQANQYMLESLRKKLNIDSGKFSIQLSDCGNTVSSTIPIALHRDWVGKKFNNGDKIMLVGFGVGYSWGACSITINLQ